MMLLNQLKITALFLVLGISTAMAQDDIRKFSISAGGGASQFYGDVESELGYNGQIGFKYATSRYFGLKANFTAGQLEGAGERGRSFENQFFQYSIRGVFNISQLANIHYYFPNFNLNAYAGVGQVVSDASFVNTSNPDLNNEFSETTTSLPVGANLEYYLSERLDIFVDINYAHTKSDLIDAYKPARTSNQASDGFATLSLGLTYKLGDQSVEHSDWSRPKDSDRELEKHKEKQKETVSAIETKIDNLQSSIENVKEKKVDQERLRRLEAEINRKLRQLQNKTDSNRKIAKRTPGKAPSKQSSKDGSQDTRQRSAPASYGDFQLSNKRFVNVIGSFKSLAKAKTFVEEVNQEGYNPGILYDFPNRYYYVHVTKSGSLDKARETLQQTRKDFGIDDAWIYFRSADDLEKLR